MNWRNYGVMAVLVLVAGCGKVDTGSPVSQEQFGEQWPLTVPNGRLMCQPFAGRVPVVIFIAPDGTEYALNDGALNSARKPSKIDPIQKLDSINPSEKKSINVLRDKGLKLCRRY